VALINIQDYNIKITYSEITTNSTLVNLLPLTVIAKAKEVGYVYFDDFDNNLKYKIALQMFRNSGIIKLNNQGIESLDHSKLPFTDRIDLQPIDEIDEITMIDYFFRYNIEVDNILVTVYKTEYQISIQVPSVFMDTLPNDINLLETNVEEFIITVYRRYISTPYGSIIFMPWYGTKIKEYLHDLSVYQVEEMLQAEMDGVTYLLKNYFILNNILDLDFYVEVKAEENIEYGIVKYRIIITINNTQYTITVQ